MYVCIFKGCPGIIFEIFSNILPVISLFNRTDDWRLMQEQCLRYVLTLLVLTTKNWLEKENLKNLTHIKNYQTAFLLGTFLYFINCIKILTIRSSFWSRCKLTHGKKKRFKDWSERIMMQNKRSLIFAKLDVCRQIHYRYWITLYDLVDIFAHNTWCTNSETKW